MKKYKFHWLDGKETIGFGENVSNAFAKLGFGNGALRSLDYYERKI